jgi:arylformamidase
MTNASRRRVPWALLLAVLSSLVVGTGSAGSLCGAIEERRQASLPSGIRIVRDVPYGRDERQRFDVYGPAQAKGAPVIFLVHGGAWRLGSRSARSVIEAKVSRWVARGLVVISTDYRMLPDADPIEQASDVARAIAAARRT